MTTDFPNNPVVLSHRVKVFHFVTNVSIAFQIVCVTTRKQRVYTLGMSHSVKRQKPQKVI